MAQDRIKIENGRKLVDDYRAAHEIASATLESRALANQQRAAIAKLKEDITDIGFVSLDDFFVSNDTYEAEILTYPSRAILKANATLEEKRIFDKAWQ